MIRTTAVRPLALTAGDPAGIGPDLVVKIAAAGFPTPLAVVADPELLDARARLLGVDIDWQVEERPPTTATPPGRCTVMPIALGCAAPPGRPDPAHAEYVLETLRRAADGCRRGEFAGMVTAPVSKAVINDAGIAFSGHTEHLASLTGGTPVMLLVCPQLRVALATTHLPLRDVADAITADRLRAVLEVLDHDLRSRFGIGRPRILVCGLNPHAGEGGHLGKEEQQVIDPVLEALRAEGLDLVGPLPADTLFTPPRLEGADAVLAMYHDQGLPVLKHLGFGHAVNVTLGLPIVRTSVDHGTAYPLAGTGNADAGSLRAAILLARELADRDGGQSGILS